MPVSYRARTPAAMLAGATLAAAVVAPGPALAQAPAPSATPTVTAIGTVAVKPTPTDRMSDASIRKAVADASAKALPKAVAKARAHAAELAAAAGVGLGPLVSVADTATPGYPFFYSSQNGTFGNGRFCGDVRNFKTIVRPDGTRRRVPAKGTHRVCRVPPTVSASVSVTFAVAS